ncbi:hypothetical protein SPB21_35240 [Leptothoe sp. ISB3NOV94-8A]
MNLSPDNVKQLPDVESSDRDGPGHGEITPLQAFLQTNPTAKQRRAFLKKHGCCPRCRRSRFDWIGWRHSWQCAHCFYLWRVGIEED